MKISINILTFLSAMMFAVTGSAQGGDRIGEEEFMNSCAVCHGVGGKGGGPIVDFLKEPPADLTQIRKKNGGRFPMQRIYDLIIDAGRNRAHGNRDMPVWGDRYAQEVIEAEGEFGMGSHPTVRARVLELVFYLATIQE